MLSSKIYIFFIINLCTKILQKTLKKQVLNGIAWRGSTDILQQVLQIVFTVVLARLLSKGDFGLVAMALLVNRFVKSVTNVSFGTAVIQSQKISKGQISAVFFIQLTINVCLTLIVFFCAETAASFFNQPELVEIIRVLAFLIFLQSLQFPNVLLQKGMKFKSFSISQIVSMIISNIVAIGLAFYGFGFWSLVFRLLIYSLIYGGLSFYFGNWKPTKPNFKGLKPLMKFGFNLLGRNIFYFFAENMIGLMTGRFLGKEIMGVFNIAYNLAIVPANKIQNVLTNVLTSGFSKIQHQANKFKNNYKKALNYISLFFIPFMLILSVSSDNLIFVLYGEKWKEAGLFLMVLSIVGIFRGLSHLVRTAIVSKGNSKIILISSFIELIVSLPIMYFLMRDYGVSGLILGYLLGALASLIYLIFSFDSILDSRFMFFNSVYKGTLIGTIIFLICYLVNFIDGSNFTLLVLKIIIALAVFMVSIYFYEKELVSKIINIIRVKLIRKDINQ